MRSNIWVSGEIADVFFKALKRKRLDKIPAIHGGVEGVLLVSQEERYVREMVSLINRGISVSLDSKEPAIIKDTDIEVEAIVLKGV